jgi:ABC-type branched-subunit amino acid transport system substrate-binding protein
VTLKTFNAAFPDGIDGHKVELEVLDDASDVTKAVAVANQMVADKVTAVITASYNPAATSQQMAVFAKNKIPVLANVLNDDYTDVAKWPYFFSMGPSDMQSGQAGADWIAKHPEIKRIATISDGIPQATEVMNDILNATKKTAPSVQVAQQVVVPPGAVDLSAAVAKLKSSNPDLLLVFTSYGFGPLWQAIQSASWTPKILAGSIFYDGFTAIGNLANSTNVITFPCVQEGHAPFPKTLTDPMDGYATVFGTSSVNYVLFVTSDNGPIELLKQSIEKNHSIDPNAIKNGLETIGDYKVGGVVDYDYSSTNHFGLTNGYGANVCKATGFSDGGYRVPVIAP